MLKQTSYFYKFTASRVEAKVLNLHVSPSRIYYEPVEAAKPKKSTTGSKDVLVKLRWLNLI